MTTKTEFMVAEFEIATKDEKERTFSGTLSTSHLDLGDGWGTRDIVHPGAFKRTMGHFRKAKDPYIPLVDSHRYSSILNVFGHLLDAEEEKTGKVLTYELEGGKVLKVDEMRFKTDWQIIDGPDGDRVLDRLRPGSVRKMSMGYRSISEDFARLKDGGQVRNLREVQLREGSLVIFPMNPETDVDRATVKLEVEALLEKAELTDEERSELSDLHNRLGALLKDEEAEVGLAPEDPRRLAIEARLLDLKARRLVTRSELG